MSCRLLSVPSLALFMLLSAVSPGAAQGIEVATRGLRFVAAWTPDRAPVEPRSIPVLGRRVSLDLTAVTVDEALKEITGQAGLNISYTTTMLPAGKRVSVHVRDVTVASALTEVLWDARVDVAVGRNGRLALVPSVGRLIGAGQNTGMVVGQVTDLGSGAALVGVDVTLQGTRFRATTAQDGRYRITDVPPGSYTVLARRIGYAPEQHPVTVTTGQIATVDVLLRPAAARIGDLVVTAEKREERLQDVPIPVTAIPAAKLAESNQLRIQDYYTSVPGLSLTSSGNGSTTLAVRGVTTGGVTNPTVGIMVDDVPFGSPISYANAVGVPDLDPSDLARIEVLRGPQGTLYGASSIGGLLKFVTVDPSTDQVSGRVQVDLNGTHNGDEAGYGFRGAVNVPVSSTFAFRASGFRRRDPGYVDIPALGLSAVNDVDVYGGRLSALWQPSATWSVKLSALLQDIDADGTSDVGLEPGLGDLAQIRQLPTTGYHNKARSYTATVSGNLGSVQLVSLSGYGVDISESIGDLSARYGGPGGDSERLFGVTGAESLRNAETRKFTQEIRLSGSLLERFDWRVGGFYNNDENPTEFFYRAVDATTLAPAGIMFYDYYPTESTEYAVFGDLTVHVTDRFDLQVGARGSHNRQVYSETFGGPWWESFGLGYELFNPPVHTKENSFTYLVAPRFRLSPDVMAYARLASGYRPGGPNPTCVLFPVPCQYAPDKTNNYELGVKGEVLNHRLYLDASIYRIDWRDIQLQISDPATGFLYYANASRAKSQGIELSAQARPFGGLTLAGWVAWTDAKLSRDLPLGGAIGSAGDRLPFSSPFSANVSVDQEFSVKPEVTTVIGGSVSYVGDRANNFANSSEVPRLELASYTQSSVRAGIRYQSWAVNLFVNNITDERGPVGYSFNTATTYVANFIQPRSAGLSLVRNF